VEWYAHQVSWQSGQAFKLNWGYYLNSLRGCSVGITYGRDLWSVLFRWPQHDWDTKFHDCHIRHSSNIKVITSKVWGAAVMLLVMGGICEVHCWDGLRIMMYIQHFMMIDLGLQVILLLLPQQFERRHCWYYWCEGGLWWAPLRWPQVAWYCQIFGVTYKMSFGLDDWIYCALYIHNSGLQVIIALSLFDTLYSSPLHMH
jgi:hypothetical protein